MDRFVPLFSQNLKKYFMLSGPEMFALTTAVNMVKNVLGLVE